MVNEEIENKIKDHYNKGQGSIQDIARVYGLSVDKVLEILGLHELRTVQTTGDLVDPSEIGPEAQFNNGKKFTVPYDTN